MPSIMDLAFCANAVYDRNIRKIGPWMRIGEPYGNDSLGFYSSIYLNENGRDLIIAFRGTDDLSDVITDIDIFLGKHPDQAVQAEKALKDALSRNKTAASIYLTGHSLGGGLASLLADRHNIPAVSFNAPGMVRSSFPAWLPGAMRSIAALGKSALNTNRNILHIRANYDFVSIGTGPRIGFVHSIPVMCETKRLDQRTLPITLPVFGTVIIMSIVGRFALCQHEMLSIINSMKGNARYSRPINFADYQ